ncbi:MAG: SDR family oxidoreductase [Phyllobacteriaceae bacterium]|nr:SDR family oxidoreductase [Phyllobacteriaceae bacterium]
MRLENKIAIVTGGSRGIGAATVRRFVEEGARVAIFDVLDKEGEALAAELAADGHDVVYEHVDVTDEDNVKTAIDGVADKWGGLDILVNNAAIVGANLFAHELSVADWEKVFAVNVKGPFLCTKHTVPHMKARKKGSIVNFSSIYGLIGNDDLPSYHATKGAVLMMTKTDAICYAPDGIRVNAVHPGSVKTEIFLAAAESHPLGRDGYIAEMSKKHPLKLGEPVDIANCVLFLASDEADFVTGASLVADGGYTAQ